MANGIKLRRGLKESLLGTLAEGELVFTTDSKEIGYKQGTVEQFVSLADINTTKTELSNTQDDLSEVKTTLETLAVPGTGAPSSVITYRYFLDISMGSNSAIKVPIASINPSLLSSKPQFFAPVLVTGGYSILINTGYSVEPTSYNARGSGIIMELDGYGNYNIDQLEDVTECSYSLEDNILFYVFYINSSQKFSTLLLDVTISVKNVADGYGNYYLVEPLNRTPVLYSLNT